MQIYAQLPAQETAFQIFKLIQSAYRRVKLTAKHRLHPNYFDGGRKAKFVFTSCQILIQRGNSKMANSATMR